MYKVIAYKLVWNGGQMTHLYLSPIQPQSVDYFCFVCQIHVSLLTLYIKWCQMPARIGSWQQIALITNKSDRSNQKGFFCIGQSLHCHENGASDAPWSEWKWYQTRMETWNANNMHYVVCVNICTSRIYQVCVYIYKTCIYTKNKYWTPCMYTYKYKNINA